LGASLNASALGVSALGLGSTASASAAITAIDAAIATVSTTRGNLGAFQNRFQSVINALGVTTENLTSSESDIKDTDMASEMVTFNKDQILLQAGTAMLAQANAVPNTILKLLQ
jgi:flagellin